MKDKLRPFSDIAERIKWHRETVSLSQEEYADTIGQKRPILSLWEAGTHRLSLDGALAIRKRYGLSLDFMYEGIDDGVAADQPDSPKAIGARLARVREIMGMSKRDFAVRADLTEQTYGPFENGKRPLTLDAAKKLRKAYGLSFEYLFFGNVAELPHRIAKGL